MKKGLLLGLLAIISMISFMSFSLPKKKALPLALYECFQTRAEAETYKNTNAAIVASDPANGTVTSGIEEKGYGPWTFSYCAYVYWERTIFDIAGSHQNGSLHDGLLPMAVEECGFTSEADAAAYINDVKAVLKNQPVTNVTSQLRSIPGPPGGYGTYYCASVYWELPIFD